MKRFELGKFNFVGKIILNDKIIISDPCYTIDTWCTKIIENIKAGTYLCYIYKESIPSWGDRVCSLLIVHQDNDIESLKFKYLGTIGVDSGTAGIFDYNYYEKYHTNVLNEDWYHKNVCNVVSDNDSHICDNLGIWSTAGFGDGVYECFTSLNKDAFKIEFITKENM